MGDQFVSGMCKETEATTLSHCSSLTKSAKIFGKIVMTQILHLIPFYCRSISTHYTTKIKINSLFLLLHDESTKAEPVLLHTPIL